MISNIIFRKIHFIVVVCFIIGCTSLFGQRPMEFLDRGLVALETSNGIFLSWRMLGTDATEIGFNLYRNDVKINASPITTSTNYVDNGGRKSDKYTVETINVGGVNELSKKVTVWPSTGPTRTTGKPSIPRKEILLPKAPNGGDASYIPGDMSVGDLDGDGEYEIIFEWEGPIPYLQAIDLEGNNLWRIKCGPNTTSTKLAFMVYDLDGDGKAEVTCKTGPGTIDGTGNFLSKGPASIDDDSAVVYRMTKHLSLDPAYITVFNGATGKEITTTNYWPSIGPLDQQMDTWGDNTGYRSSSIKAGVLYNKDLGPVVVFTRGIYTRIAMGAFTFDGQSLKRVWTFDTQTEGYENYRGQGNHSVAVGDVDNDGSDEFIYGACAIDDDGTGLYTTGRGHGDSHHLADHDPDHPGMEFYQGHENGTYGISMRDAGTGEILWEILSPSDVGRAWAADVNPNYRGSEVVSISTSDYDCKGNLIPTNYNSYYQPVWFDGDVQRELRSGASLNGDGRLFTGWYYGAATIHSTKEDANLVADIFGDWREEIIYRRDDNKALIIFSSWFPTTRKNYTLMHDPTYRMNIVTQNIGYNQPANVGYYFADGAPIPNIKLIKYDSTKVVANVPDTTIPVIDNVSNLTQPINNECLAYLPNYAEILNVTDEVYDAFYFKQTPEPGTLIGNVGDKISVSVYVNDGFGNNSKTVTFNVTAIDDMAPIITKGFTNHSLRVADGCDKELPDYAKYVTATDNCSSNITITMQPEAGIILTGNGDSVLVTLTFDDNQGNKVDSSFTVTLSAPNCYPQTTSDATKKTFELTPNPVVDYLTINLPQAPVAGATIEILNLSSQKLFETKLKNKSTTINLQDLSAGIYFIKFVNGSNTTIEYIIKR